MFPRKVNFSSWLRPGKKAVLVQKMEHGLAEAIVGYRDDPVVGPLILVGAGGRLRSSTGISRSRSRR
jgi:acyl-CoA synthetase (NDP forming)